MDCARFGQQPLCWITTPFGDHAFLAVELPAGASEVELFYRPTGFVVGGAITATALLGLAMAWAIGRRRKNSPAA